MLKLCPDSKKRKKFIKKSYTPDEAFVYVGLCGLAGAANCCQKNIALLTESGKSPARLRGAISSGQGLDQISSGKM